MCAESRGKSRSDELTDVRIPAGQEHLPEMVGTEFIFRFYRLLKGATLYDRNNATIEKLTQEVLQTVNPFVQSQGQLYLKIVRDNFFFNNIRIPVKADRYSVFKIFTMEMGKRMIGELEFSEAIEGPKLKDFVFLLAKLDDGNRLIMLLDVANLMRDRKLREAGSYGYLVKAVIPNHALRAAAQAKELVIRFEVDEALPGGLALYGERFGRCPLDPTLVITTKRPK